MARTQQQRREDTIARLLASIDTIAEVGYARTDAKLRDTLQEVMTAYTAKIYEAARTVPSAAEIEAFGEENFAALVAVLINTFDGAAMFRHVLTHPEIEARRIPVLMSLLNAACP